MSADHLNGLIEETLAASDEADPRRIARQLLPRLTPEMRDGLLLRGLTDVVYACVRMVRDGGATRCPGTSKWQIMQQRVCIGGEWKLLADCDSAALRTLAEQHREIATRNLARAEQYEALADELERTGCQTVGELTEHGAGVAA